MRRMGLMLSVTLIVGIAVGVIGAQVLNAQYGQPSGQAQEPIKRTLLLKTDLQGIEGQEANVMMVEVAPGERSGKHYHPGPVLVYVLSGGGTFEMEGDAPKAIKPGVAFYVPPKRVHEDVAGSSGEKVLAVFITPKGQPITVPVK